MHTAPPPRPLLCRSLPRVYVRRVYVRVSLAVYERVNRSSKRPQVAPQASFASCQCQFFPRLELDSPQNPTFPDSEGPRMPPPAAPSLAKPQQLFPHRLTDFAPPLCVDPPESMKPSLYPRLPRLFSPALCCAVTARSPQSREFALGRKGQFRSRTPHIAPQAAPAPANVIFFPRLQSTVLPTPRLKYVLLSLKRSLLAHFSGC